MHEALSELNDLKERIEFLVSYSLSRSGDPRRLLVSFNKEHVQESEDYEVELLLNSFHERKLVNGGMCYLKHCEILDNEVPYSARLLRVAHFGESFLVNGKKYFPCVIAVVLSQGFAYMERTIFMDEDSPVKVRSRFKVSESDIPRLISAVRDNAHGVLFRNGI